MDIVIWFVTGLISGLIFSHFWNRGGKRNKEVSARPRVPTTALVLVGALGLMVALMLGSAGTIYAQTAVPIPTLAFGDALTSVVTNANTWTPAFTPIFGVGYGIQVALALLALVGTVVVGAIVSALKNR